MDFGFSEAGVYGEYGGVCGGGVGAEEEEDGAGMGTFHPSFFRIQFLSQEQGADSRGSSGLAGLELGPCLPVTKEEMPFHLSCGPASFRLFSIFILQLPHLFGICLFPFFFFWVIR